MFIPSFLLLQIAFVRTDFSCEDLSQHPNYALLANQDCGRSKYSNPEVEISSRILRGQDAELNEFPWIAILILKDLNTNETSRCDGTLINDIYVLTAAHCANHWEILSVKFALHNQWTDSFCVAENCSEAVKSGSKESKIHENTIIDYPTTILNDIALIRLDNPVTFNEYVRPICLPLSCDLRKREFMDDQMVFAGWGYLEYAPENEGQDSTILQKVNVTVTEKETLHDVDYDTDVPIFHESQISAGQEDTGVCPGDSGGPLMYWDESSGRYYQTGVASHANHCRPNRSDYDHDSVFMRVSYYVPWILDNIRP